MNVATTYTGFHKLVRNIADSYWSKNENRTRYISRSPTANKNSGPVCQTNTPIGKWRNEIRKFQHCDVGTPYYMRCNPWLKELRLTDDSKTYEQHNFTIVNRIPYDELRRHNVVF
jgi:hypothetical protein